MKAKQPHGAPRDLRNIRIKMANPVCPLKDGDRVKHKLFGLGTVSGKPVKSVRDDLGWTVLVKWDDKNRTASSVVHTFLEKV